MLLFRNPVFNEEGLLNITVRRGLKWAKTFTDKHPVDCPIATADEPEEQIGMAHVIGIKTYDALVDIPLHYIFFEHDPACRNFQGLYRKMSEAYGETFRIDEPVTVIFFHYKPDEESED